MTSRLLRVGFTALVVVTGCTEDLAPVTRAWTDTATSFASQLAGFKQTLGDLQKKAADLKDVDRDDREAMDLKAKLDASMAGYDQTLSDAQAVIVTGTGAVKDALKGGKVAAVQAAIDQAKASFEGTVAKLPAQQKVVEELVDGLNARAQVAAVKEKAAVEAVKAVAPPVLDVTRSGEADYTALDFEPGEETLAVGRPGTKANLDALAALLNSCPEMLVEVEGHTSKVGDAKKNTSLSARRAQVVTRFLINDGKVSPSKIKKVYGYGSDKPLVPEPAPGSAEEQSFDPAKLAEARDRNERIHVRIIRPCPGGK
jgi:outer membrane protein OmpA-like peptidoglycan-associated protein